jgi:ubiquinone/menaquinone biosynthesis C-methylase UbiE
MQKPEDYTYVIDPESPAEQVRLAKQDIFLNEMLGTELLPPDLLLDRARPTQILDIGSGPGTWALTVAHRYPDTQITGIDISEVNVKYANAQVRVEHKDDRVSFEAMDATKPLIFDDNSFDLVNARAINGFLTLATWQTLMVELGRVVCPGGIVRIIESDFLGRTTSPSYDHLQEMLLTISKKDPTRLPAATPRLRFFFERAGFTDLQDRGYCIDFSAGAPAHDACIENFTVAFTLIKPYVVGLGLVSAEAYDQLRHQAIAEMYSADFGGIWFWRAMWGRKPETI